MNGLQFEELPAQQATKIKNQLHTQWQIEKNALSKSWFSDRGKFETAKAKLNAKYQRLELDALTKLQEQQREQQQVQQLIQQPQERTRAGEAALRMQLRPEAERLVFPTEQKPFTFTQIVSLAREIQNTAERAEQEPWYKWGEEKTRKSLIDQYLATVNLLRVQDPRAFGPDRAKTFNDVWNRVMSTDPQFANWFDKQGKPPVEMKMITAEGSIAGAMKEKALGKSPLGQTLNKQKKTLPATRYTPGGFGGWDIGAAPKKETGTIRVRDKNGRIGTIPAHQWPEADAAGYTRI